MDCCTARGNPPPPLPIPLPCRIRASVPMESLPSLASRELEFIGQTVKFESGWNLEGSAANVYVYVGTIGMINKSCVTLLHATRFTREDAPVYLSGGADNRSWSTTASPLRERFFTRLDQDWNREDGRGFTTTAAPAGEVFPATLSPDGRSTTTTPCWNLLTFPEVPAVEGAAGQSGMRQMSECRSMGPFPYLTFSRERMINVEFLIHRPTPTACSPPSASQPAAQKGKTEHPLPLTHSALLTPPSTPEGLLRCQDKRLFDLQCLRMLVRCYLVHTCRGYNMNHIPLKTFIVCQGNHIISDDVLESIAEEELTMLLATDQAMLNDPAFSSRRAGALTLGSESPMDLVRVWLLFFKGEQIRWWTRLTGYLLFGLAVVSILVSLITLVTGFGYPSALVRGFIQARGFVLFIIPVCIVLPGVSLVFLGFTIQPPLGKFLSSLVCRYVWNAMIFYDCISIVSNLVMITDSASNYYTNKAGESAKCDFFEQYQCSGFFSPISNNAATRMSSNMAEDASNLCGGRFAYPYPCGPIFVSQLRKCFFPISMLLWVIGCAAFCDFLFTAWTTFNLWNFDHQFRGR